MLGRIVFLRSSLLAICFAASSQRALAQTAPDRDARDDTPTGPAPAPRSIESAVAQEASGATVTIAGRATVNAGQLQSGSLDVAIQDATAGIRVFSRSLKKLPVHEGDSLVAALGNDWRTVATRRAMIAPAPQRPGHFGQGG